MVVAAVLPGVAKAPAGVDGSAVADL